MLREGKLQSSEAESLKPQVSEEQDTTEAETTAHTSEYHFPCSPQHTE